MVLRDEKGETRHYLLVIKGGGETIEVDGASLASLSIGAPLGRACIKKTEGDEVTCNDKAYEVVDVL